MTCSILNFVILAGSTSAETITMCIKGCDHTSINTAITGDVIELLPETYFA